MKHICVYGASSTSLHPKYYDFAYQVGAELAKAGAGMIFGGGDKGLMGAAARGVHDNGGYLTGVIPVRLHQPGVAYPHCDELIVTQTMHERKSVMEERGSGFIVLPGGNGTLEELLEAMTLKQLKYHDHPIVILNQDHFYEPLLEMFDRCVRRGFTHMVFANLYRLAYTPKEAVQLSLIEDVQELPDKVDLVDLPPTEEE